jgi:hypothetical protein
MILNTNLLLVIVLDFKSKGGSGTSRTNSLKFFSALPNLLIAMHVNIAESNLSAEDIISFELIFGLLLVSKSYRPELELMPIEFFFHSISIASPSSP